MVKNPLGVGASPLGGLQGAEDHNTKPKHPQGTGAEAWMSPLLFCAGGEGFGFEGTDHWGAYWLGELQRQEIRAAWVVRPKNPAHDK